ncbi:phospholipase D-like domain-containing protein [Verrucomicrobiaceae bacterium 227]
MTELETLLTSSLEDYALSRSEKKELKIHIAKLAGDTTAQAKTRQFAFKLAHQGIEEFGQITAMDWLQGVIKLLYASENKIKANAYFSPGDDCLHRICSFINEAQKSLDICVFTITDNRIVDVLTKAIDRKVEIRIISDNDKSEDRGSDLDRLLRMGIECRFDRTDAHMHHKFALADNGHLLTGSYNWTRSAAMVNDENIIVTDHPKLVIKFADKFSSMWDHLRH